MAVYQGNGIWPMFFFGFAGIFVITQMHGLGLSARVRWLLFGLYMLAALQIYNQRGWNRLYGLVSIPLIEYLSVGVLALLFAAGIRIVSWINNRGQIQAA